MGALPPLGIGKHSAVVLIAVRVREMAEWPLRGIPVSIRDPGRGAQVAGGSGESQGVRESHLLSSR